MGAAWRPAGEAEVVSDEVVWGHRNWLRESSHPWGAAAPLFMVENGSWWRTDEVSCSKVTRRTEPGAPATGRQSNPTSHRSLRRFGITSEHPAWLANTIRIDQASVVRRGIPEVSISHRQRSRKQGYRTILERRVRASHRRVHGVPFPGSFPTLRLLATSDSPWRQPHPDCVLR